VDQNDSELKTDIARIDRRLMRVAARNNARQPGP